MRLNVRQFWVLLRKDLKVEMRSPGVLYTMLLFAVLLVTIFAFAFFIVDDNVRSYAPGLVWVAILFTSSLGTARIFDREQSEDCLQGLLLAVANPRTIFIEKALLSFLFSGLMAVLVVPLVVLFFDLYVPSIGWLALIVFQGVLGFAFIGTLFAGLMSRVVLREVLFPLIVFPLIIPLFIAGVKATGLVFQLSLIHI